MNKFNYILLFFLLAAASCVSKKKYAQLDAQLKEQQSLSQNYRAKMDTLTMLNVRLRDSLKRSDSLLALEQKKASERKDGVTMVSPGPRKSALSKDDEYQKKAVFIYNFTRQVDWPANNNEKFIIGVYGSSPLYDKLRKTSEGKRAQGKAIEIKTFTAANLEPCYILFVPHSNIGELSRIKGKLKDQAVLLVTEEQYWSSSTSHINFFVDDVHLRYQLNKAGAEKVGLKMTQDLVKFAN